VVTPVRNQEIKSPQPATGMPEAEQILKRMWECGCGCGCQLLSALLPSKKLCFGRKHCLFCSDPELLSWTRRSSLTPHILCQLVISV
jgi:hypothetical protein